MEESQDAQPEAHKTYDFNLISGDATMLLSAKELTGEYARMCFTNMSACGQNSRTLLQHDELIYSMDSYMHTYIHYVVTK